MTEHGISRERFNQIMSRYEQFIQGMDKECDPVKVFDPLPKKQLEELELIRDISKYLQEKKDEDILAANKAEKEEKESVEVEEAKQEEK